MNKDLVHVTGYLDPQHFEEMEKLRKARMSRITRSQWIDQAVAEKVEREKGNAGDPTPRPLRGDTLSHADRP